MIESLDCPTNFPSRRVTRDGIASRYLCICVHVMCSFCGCCGLLSAYEIHMYPDIVHLPWRTIETQPACRRLVRWNSNENIPPSPNDFVRVAVSAWHASHLHVFAFVGAVGVRGLDLEVEPERTSGGFCNACTEYSVHVFCYVALSVFLLVFVWSCL